MRINYKKIIPKYFNSKSVFAYAYLFKRKKFCLKIHKSKSELNIQNSLRSSIFICNSSLSPFFISLCSSSSRPNLFGRVHLQMNTINPTKTGKTISILNSFFGIKKQIKFSLPLYIPGPFSGIVKAQREKNGFKQASAFSRSSPWIFLCFPSMKKKLNKKRSKGLFFFKLESSSNTLGKSEAEKKFFSRNFDKNRLKKFVMWFSKKWGLTKTLTLLETLKYLGFKYAQLSGLSLNIEDLYIPHEKEFLVNVNDFSLLEEEFKVFQKLNDQTNYSVKFISTWTLMNQLLRNAFLQYFKTGIKSLDNYSKYSLNTMTKKNNSRKQKTNSYTGSDSLYIMAFSGARGNMSQVSQLTLMRGLMSDPLGNLVEFPIISNFKEGLNLTEYLISCYGARKGIIDTGLRTATAGDFTRRLVDVAHSVIIRSYDCLTHNGIYINDLVLFQSQKTLLSLEQRLIGRIIANNSRVSLNYRNKEIPSSSFFSNFSLLSSISSILSKETENGEESPAVSLDEKIQFYQKSKSRTKQPGSKTIFLKSHSESPIMESHWSGISPNFHFKNKTRSPAASFEKNLAIDQKSELLDKSYLKNNDAASLKAQKAFKDTTNYKFHEEVLIRSPLTCETKSTSFFCRKCYGWNAMGRLVDIGDAVGVLAAQSLGEPGTQLTLRTFHTGGIYSESAAEFKLLVPFNGNLIIPNYCSIKRYFNLKEKISTFVAWNKQSIYHYGSRFTFGSNNLDSFNGYPKYYDAASFTASKGSLIKEAGSENPMKYLYESNSRLACLSTTLFAKNKEVLSKPSTKKSFFFSDENNQKFSPMYKHEKFPMTINYNLYKMWLPAVYTRNGKENDERTSPGFETYDYFLYRPTFEITSIDNTYTSDLLLSQQANTSHFFPTTQKNNAYPSPTENSTQNTKFEEITPKNPFEVFDQGKTIEYLDNITGESSSSKIPITDKSVMELEREKIRNGELGGKNETEYLRKSIIESIFKNLSPQKFFIKFLQASLPLTSSQLEKKIYPSVWNHTYKKNTTSLTVGQKYGKKTESHMSEGYELDSEKLNKISHREKLENDAIALLSKRKDYAHSELSDAGEEEISLPIRTVNKSLNKNPRSPIDMLNFFSVNQASHFINQSQISNEVQLKSFNNLQNEKQKILSEAWEISLTSPPLKSSPMVHNFPSNWNRSKDDIFKLNPIQNNHISLMVLESTLIFSHYFISYFYNLSSQLYITNLKILNPFIDSDSLSTSNDIQKIIKPKKFHQNNISNSITLDNFCNIEEKINLKRKTQDTFKSFGEREILNNTANTSSRLLKANTEKHDFWPVNNTNNIVYQEIEKVFYYQYFFINNSLIEALNKKKIENQTYKYLNRSPKPKIRRPIGAFLYPDMKIQDSPYFKTWFLHKLYTRKHPKGFSFSQLPLLHRDKRTGKKDSSDILSSKTNNLIIENQSEQQVFFLQDKERLINQPFLIKTANSTNEKIIPGTKSSEGSYKNSGKKTKEGSTKSKKNLSLSDLEKFAYQNDQTTQIILLLKAEGNIKKNTTILEIQEQTNGLLKKKKNYFFFTVPLKKGIFNQEIPSYLSTTVFTSAFFNYKLTTFSLPIKQAVLNQNMKFLLNVFSLMDPIKKFNKTIAHSRQVFLPRWRERRISPTQKEKKENGMESSEKKLKKNYIASPFYGIQMVFMKRSVLKTIHPSSVFSRSSFRQTEKRRTVQPTNIKNLKSSSGRLLFKEEKAKNKQRKTHVPTATFSSSERSILKNITGAKALFYSIFLPYQFFFFYFQKEWKKQKKNTILSPIKKKAKSFFRPCQDSKTTYKANQSAAVKQQNNFHKQSFLILNSTTPDAYFSVFSRRFSAFSYFFHNVKEQENRENERKKEERKNIEYNRLQMKQRDEKFSSHRGILENGEFTLPHFKWPLSHLKWGIPKSRSLDALLNKNTQNKSKYSYRQTELNLTLILNIKKIIKRKKSACRLSRSACRLSRFDKNTNSIVLTKQSQTPPGLFYGSVRPFFYNLPSIPFSFSFFPLKIKKTHLYKPLSGKKPYRKKFSLLPSFLRLRFSQFFLLKKVKNRQRKIIMTPFEGAYLVNSSISFRFFPFLKEKDLGDQRNHVTKVVFFKKKEYFINFYSFRNMLVTGCKQQNKVLWYSLISAGSKQFDYTCFSPKIPVRPKSKSRISFQKNKARQPVSRDFSFFTNSKLLSEIKKNSSLLSLLSVDRTANNHVYKKNTFKDPVLFEMSVTKQSNQQMTIFSLLSIWSKFTINKKIKPSFYYSVVDPVISNQKNIFDLGFYFSLSTLNLKHSLQPMTKKLSLYRKENRKNKLANFFSNMIVDISPRFFPLFSLSRSKRKKATYSEFSRTLFLNSALFSKDTTLDGFYFSRPYPNHVPQTHIDLFGTEKRRILKKLNNQKMVQVKHHVNRKEHGTKKENDKKQNMFSFYSFPFNLSRLSSYGLDKDQKTVSKNFSSKQILVNRKKKKKKTGTFPLSSQYITGRQLPRSGRQLPRSGRQLPRLNLKKKYRKRQKIKFKLPNHMKKDNFISRTKFSHITITNRQGLLIPFHLMSKNCYISLYHQNFLTKNIKLNVQRASLSHKKQLNSPKLSPGPQYSNRKTEQAEIISVPVFPHVISPVPWKKEKIILVNRNDKNKRRESFQNEKNKMRERIMPELAYDKSFQPNSASMFAIPKQAIDFSAIAPDFLFMTPTRVMKNSEKKQKLVTVSSLRRKYPKGISDEIFFSTRKRFIDSVKRFSIVPYSLASYTKGKEYGTTVQGKTNIKTNLSVFNYSTYGWFVRKKKLNSTEIFSIIPSAFLFPFLFVIQQSDFVSHKKKLPFFYKTKTKQSLYSSFFYKQNTGFIINSSTFFGKYLKMTDSISWLSNTSNTKWLKTETYLSKGGLAFHLFSQKYDYSNNKDNNATINVNKKKKKDLNSNYHFGISFDRTVRVGK